VRHGVVRLFAYGWLGSAGSARVRGRARSCRRALALSPCDRAHGLRSSCAQPNAVERQLSHRSARSSRTMPAWLARGPLCEPESKSRARACTRGIEESFQTADARRRVSPYREIRWAQLILLRPTSFLEQGSRYVTRGSTAESAAPSRPSAWFENNADAEQASSGRRAHHAAQRDGR